METVRAVAFWMATLVSALLIFAVIAFAVVGYAYLAAHTAFAQSRIWQLTIIFGLLLIVAGAVFSGIFFGWRQERREVRDLRQRTHDLQQQIRNLERQAASGGRHQ